MTPQKTRSKPKTKVKRKDSKESPTTTSTTLTSLQPSPSALANLTPSPEDVRDILTFETVKELAEFYRAVGWTPAMELQILVNIIQTTDNDVTRLRALKDLQARRAEILRNSGLMVKATRVQKNADGGQTMFSANIVAAALNYNPKLKGAIADEQKEKKKNTKKVPQDAGAENPLGSDDDADSRANGTNGNSGTDGAIDGHRPPTGSVTLTGIATRRRG